MDQQKCRVIIQQFCPQLRLNLPLYHHSSQLYSQPVIQVEYQQNHQLIHHQANPHKFEVMNRLSYLPLFHHFFHRAHPQIFLVMDQLCVHLCYLPLFHRFFLRDHQQIFLLMDQLYGHLYHLPLVLPRKYLVMDLRCVRLNAHLHHLLLLRRRAHPRHVLLYVHLYHLPLVHRYLRQGHPHKYQTMDQLFFQLYVRLLRLQFIHHWRYFHRIHPNKHQVMDQHYVRLCHLPLVLRAHLHVFQVATPHSNLPSLYRRSHPLSPH
mmetsp:Transcript_31451/g.42953  ORF Transcript_31451/g.42953 Transcript_31451/m.42953 type:complete len:263 (+) Transcript_31451:128-916(+)